MSKINYATKTVQKPKPIEKLCLQHANDVKASKAYYRGEYAKRLLSHPKNGLNHSELARDIFKISPQALSLTFKSRK